MKIKRPLLLVSPLTGTPFIVTAYRTSTVSDRCSTIIATTQYEVPDVEFAQAVEEWRKAKRRQVRRRKKATSKGG